MKETAIQKLENRVKIHFDKIHIYTLRRSKQTWTKDGKLVCTVEPFATVAIAKKIGGCLWNRAITVCSPKDQFSYVEGHKRVLGLLLKMAFSQDQGIERTKFSVKRETGERRMWCKLIDTFPARERFYHCDYGVQLTEGEEDLVHRAEMSKNKNGTVQNTTAIFSRGFDVVEELEAAKKRLEECVVIKK